MGANGAKTVIYVEDEPAVQRLVQFWLEDAGFQVVLAGDGAEGMALIRQSPPDLVVTDALYQRFLDAPKGQLAKSRASVVRAATLAEVGVSLHLGPDLLLGKGESASGGAEKPSILADAVEAVIGAVFVDGGMAPARSFVLDQLDERISAAASQPGARDYKTRLQEIVTESGPDHLKRFEATVRIGGEVRGTGDGSSKKEAEQRAARAAWEARSPEDGASDV